LGDAGVRPEPLFADGQKELAVNGELEYLVLVPVHQPNVVIFVQVDGVGEGDQAGAPG
jgi:hypothetical protein